MTNRKMRSAFNDLMLLVKPNKGVSAEQVGAALARFAKASRHEKALSPDIEYDGERTITVFGKSLELPVPIYREVWQNGRQYKAHDMVTWDGSLWICRAETKDQPGTSDNWKLTAKRGRDARVRA